ncbi:MAG TPA: GYD domain-containing protein [Syntrophobacteraceae bacterium]|nr:GYD domain-containing protein [Syntrophobacteraceae bacterium]
MPTYITLARWTQEGMEKIKESPARLHAFKQAVKSAGGEVKAFYMVTGQYDMVIVSEAPNDDAIAKVALATGSKGSVRSETLRAFTEEEYRKIIAALP